MESGLKNRFCAEQGHDKTNELAEKNGGPVIKAMQHYLI